MVVHHSSENEISIQYDTILSLSQVSCIEDAGDIILDALMKRDEIDICGFYLLDEKSKIFNLISSKNISDGFISLVTTIDVETYWYGTILKQNKPYFCYYPEALKKRESEEYLVKEKEGILALGVIPFLYKNNLIAFINFGSKRYKKFSPRTKSLILEFTKDITSTIRRIIDEERILMGKQNYEALLDLSTNLFFICDYDYNIITCNRIAADKLGYSQEELNNMNLLDLIPPERKDDSKCIIENMMNGKLQYCNIPYITKTKKLIPVYFQLFKSVVMGQDVLIIVTTDISGQYEKEQELLYRAKMEKTLSEISIKLSSDAPVCLTNILKMVGSALHVNRTYIFEFHDNLKKMSNTYEWCSDGIDAQIDFLQNIETTLFPWWMDSLMSDEIICIEDISMMEAVASNEKEILSQQGIKSLLVVPFFNGDTLRGYVGFDQTLYKREWIKEDLHILRVFAQLLENYYKRQEMMQSLHEQKNELKKKHEELEDFVKLLYHDIQTPLFTIGMYIDILLKSISNNDIDEMRKSSIIIKSNVMQISSYAKTLGDSFRNTDKDAEKSMIYK